MRQINLIITDIVKRLDENSLVVQRDGDPGDSAYRSSIFAFLLKMMEHPQAKDYYDVMISHLTVSPGVFHRTATSSHWGYNSNNLSRDQAAAIKLAATVNNDVQSIEEFNEESHNRQDELAQIPRWGKWLAKINWLIPFHQNVHPGTDAPDNFRKIPDTFGWNEISNEMRRKDKWWSYPLLLVRDVAFIFGLYERKKQLWDYDSLYAKDLIYANLVMPTPFSWLAKKLYRRTDYIKHIRFNYSDDNNGVEPLGELYEVVCRKYINEED